jgi:anti-sigma factor RsiW
MPLIDKKPRDMRHIPEEELHAYLDQALSRSQCVEIESHLASCPACRQARDGIAALRDRTTALLATLAPPRRIKPAYADLRAQATARVMERRRIVRAVGWAASISLALGLGWIANSWIGAGPPQATAVAPLSAAPVTMPESSPAPQVEVPDRGSQTRVAAEPRPIPSRTREPEPRTPDTSLAGETDRFQSVAEGIPTEPLRVEITPVQQRAGDLPTAGLWRSVSWDGAQAESDSWIPRVEGLPVVTVQVQGDEQGSGQPLTVVAQRLSSGQMIRTVEGPIAKVSDLLSHQSGPTVTASIEMNDNSGTRRDDRMLAIYGSVSIDSLRAFLLKVH